MFPDCHTVSFTRMQLEENVKGAGPLPANPVYPGDAIRGGATCLNTLLRGGAHLACVVSDGTV